VKYPRSFDQLANDEQEKLSLSRNTISLLAEVETEPTGMHNRDACYPPH
jgi:hypothetical protein